MNVRTDLTAVIKIYVAKIAPVRELVHTPDSEYAILKEIICKEQWGM